MTSFAQSPDPALIGKTLQKKVTSRTIFSRVMTAIAAACIVITLIPLFAVLYYVLIQGFSRVNLDLFTPASTTPWTFWKGALLMRF